VTADRRLQIGGWAALLVAILLPLDFVAIRLWPVSPDGAANAAVAVAVLRLVLDVALLVAVVGLDGLFRSIAPGQASRVLAIGLVGAVLGVVAGQSSGQIVGPIGWLALLSGVLIGLWFFLGGAILMSGGRGLARIGWSGMIGGGAMILASVSSALGLGGATGGAPDELPIRDWFHLIGLLVVIYLVRTWRYVVGGRLPAPGIL
jgi:hypothetical protein